MAPKGSDEYILGVLRKFYPGSWLPYGVEQIERNSAETFALVSTNNGRLDYIETMSEWSHRVNQISLRKILAGWPLVFQFIRDPDFRYKSESLLDSYNQKCFQRFIMDHQRMVLEAI